MRLHGCFKRSFGVWAICDADMVMCYLGEHSKDLTREGMVNARHKSFMLFLVVAQYPALREVVH